MNKFLKKDDVVELLIEEGYLRDNESISLRNPDDYNGNIC